MKTYIVLLRGVNVGGKNKVSMTELKQCLEQQGCQNVTTYINSGNVLLQSDRTAEILMPQIETLISQKFSLGSSIIKVLVLTTDQLKAVIAEKPPGFGEQPEIYHSDAIFLIGINAEQAMAVFSPREGVDQVWPGSGVIYSQRLSAERTKSRLSKIIGTPVYQSMTIRSWSTTTKLYALAQAMPDTISA